MTNHDDLTAQAQHAAAAKDYHRAHALLDQLISQLRQEGRHLRIRPLLEQKADIYLQMRAEDDQTFTALEIEDLLHTIYDDYGWESARPLYERILALTEHITSPNSVESEILRNDMAHLEIRHTRAQRWARLRQGTSDVHSQVLEGIDDIPWANLQHAYGSAADVPMLLRGLLDESADIRYEADQTLSNTIVHQGTVYEASAYAVPFLLRLLSWKNTPAKANILELIAYIASGNAGLSKNSDEAERSRWDEIFAKHGTDFATELAQGLRAVTTANAAAAEGLPLYFRLLYDGNSRLRRAAIEILENFPQHSDAIAPQLIEALSRTEDPDDAFIMIASLDAVLDDSQHSQETFATLMAQHTGQNAYCAAAALAKRAGPRTPQAAIDLIIEQMPHDTSKLFARRGPQALLSIAQGAGAELLRRLPGIKDIKTALLLTATMLDLEFHAGQLRPKHPSFNMKITFYFHPHQEPDRPRDPAALTASQRQLLHHLLAHDALWEQPHNLLNLYGLPSEREALRAFLKQ